MRWRLLLALLVSASACMTFVHLEGGLCKTDEHCPRDAGLVCATAGAVSCTCQVAGPAVVACPTGPPAEAGDGGRAFGCDGGELEPAFSWTQHEYWVLPREGTQTLEFELQSPGAQVEVSGADASVVGTTWALPVPSGVAARVEVAWTVAGADGGTVRYRFRVMPAPRTVPFASARAGVLGGSLAFADQVLVAGERSTYGAIRFFDLSEGRESSYAAAAGGGFGDLGASVAASSGFALVGAPTSPDGGQALVFVVTPRTDGGPRAVSDVSLTPLGTEAGGMGRAVALADDLAACGDGAGHVGLYQRNVLGGDWPLVAHFDGGGAFGGAVGLSTQRLVIGAPSAVEGTRRAELVQCWSREGAGAWTPVAPPRGFDGGVRKPYTPAFALEDERLVVGDPAADSPAAYSVGAAWVYGWLDGGWEPEADLTSPVPKESFGAAVALRAGLLAVGAPAHRVGSNEIGAVFIYARSVEGAWEQVGLLRPPGLGGGAQVGAAVAWGPGLLAVGAPGADGQQGVVFVYPY